MDLFSGIGGLSIALKDWVKTIAYCEADKHAQGVLLSLERNSTTLATIAGGQLNPTWVEWLMGFPLEWSALNALGMRWFQFKPKKHLKSCST